MGLRLSSSATQSEALVEELLDNHHFSSDGLSILPQGTPTNNTDGKSSSFSSTGLKPAETFATELGAALLEPAALPADKTDAQRLAEALGLAYAPFQHITGAGQREDARPSS